MLHVAFRNPNQHPKSSSFHEKSGKFLAEQINYILHIPIDTISTVCGSYLALLGHAWSHNSKYLLITFMIANYFGKDWFGIDYIIQCIVNELKSVKKGYYLSFGKNNYLFLGDIAISYERCLREASSQNIQFNKHCCRLLVHAILHLLGYDHDISVRASKMQLMETRVLNSVLTNRPKFINI